jgi:hypothetical protein
MQMENRQILISGFIGGLVAAIFSSIPYLNFINCFCCIGIMLGGTTALVYYNHHAGPGNFIGTAQAITLGIAAGLMGAFLSLLISWLVYLRYGHWEIRLLQSMMDRMTEIPEYLEKTIGELENEENKGFQLFAMLSSNLLLYPVFCMIGSLLTRIFLNKKYTLS